LGAGVIERLTKIHRCAEPICSSGRELTARVAMASAEISLAISAGCFGLVIGFFAGYAPRAYMSYLRRRAKN